MNHTQSTLHDLSKHIDNTYEKFFFIENSLPFNDHQMNRINFFSMDSSDEISQLFDSKLSNILTNDGIKLIFSNGDWVLCRPSGTEPILRIYAESKQKKQATAYIDQVKLILNS